MKHAICLVLVLAAAAFAEKSVVSFRLRKQPQEKRRGWLLECNEQAFRFERFGGGRKIWVPWDELVEEDARVLRVRLKLDLTDDERLGLIPGQRLHFVGGGSVDGLLVRVDEERRHWLKVRGILLPYPEDRIESVAQVKVQENAIYTDDEVYARRLARTPPRTARQHRALADHLLEIGNFERAERHYREAMALKPSLRHELQPRLDEIAEYLTDAEVKKVLGRARATANLHGDYEKAKAILRRFIDNHPERKRAALRILDGVERRRVEKLRKRFRMVKHEEFHRCVRHYLISKRPTIDEALSWVTSRLEKTLRQRIAERLGLTGKELDDFLKDKSHSSPHWANYWSGSFIFSPRAVRGKHSKRVVRGDKDRWWAAYGDAGPRGSFLRAYAAERLPRLFEMVQVKTPACESCGGKGQVKHMSVHPLSSLGGSAGNGAGHEWFQRCPRCFGAKHDRVVGYR